MEKALRYTVSFSLGLEDYDPIISFADFKTKAKAVKEARLIRATGTISYPKIYRIWVYDNKKECEVWEGIMK